MRRIISSMSNGFFALPRRRVVDARADMGGDGFADPDRFVATNPRGGKKNAGCRTGCDIRRVVRSSSLR